MMGPRAAAVPVTARGRPQEGREAALRLKAFGATSLARGRPGKEAAMCVVGGGCLAVAPCQTGHCWGCWTPGHKQSYEHHWPGSWRGLRGLWGQSNVLVGGLEGPVREQEGGGPCSSPGPGYRLLVLCWDLCCWEPVEDGAAGVPQADWSLRQCVRGVAPPFLSCPAWAPCKTLLTWKGCSKAKEPSLPTNQPVCLNHPLPPNSQDLFSFQLGNASYLSAQLL